MRVCISDAGAALLAIGLELDRLQAEEIELKHKLEVNDARQLVLQDAARELLRVGTYELNI